MQVYYLNGKFIPENKALIQVNDLGFTRGCGVFDFLRTYNSQAFELFAHLKRLKQSAQKAKIPFYWRLNKLKDLVLEIIRRNKIKNAGIRIIITPGQGNEKGGFETKGFPSLAFLIEPIIRYPQEFYQKGISLLTTSQKRIFPEIKTTNYLPAFISLKQAKKQKYEDILFLDEKNNVLEASTSNFFVIKNNKIITPKKHILLGITRKIVLNIASCFSIEQREIPLNELKRVEEAFITSTTREIMPVRKIDNVIIGQGEPGEKTKRLIEFFRAYIKKKISI